MKAVSAGFASHLEQDTTRLATCWKVKRSDGTVLGFTDHDRDIAIDAGDGDGSVTYQAASGYSRSAITANAKFKVVDLEITGFLESAALTDADLRAGRYDFAELKIFHVVWDDPGLGVLKLKVGQLGQVTVKDKAFVAEERDLTDRYHSQKIVELATPDCRADLGDARCKVQLDPPAWTTVSEAVARTAKDAQGPAAGSPTQVNVVKPSVFNDRHFKCVTAGVTGASEPAWDTTLGAQTSDGSVTWEAIRALTVQGTVAAVSDRRTFAIAYAGDAPDGFFDVGVITWTSGANAGLKREVKLYTVSPNAVVLYLPMPADIQPGDGFTMTAGCDKAFAVCRDTFDNIRNFRGEPHVPGNDLMFATPDAPA